MYLDAVGRRWCILVVSALLVAACAEDKPPPDHTDLNPEETAPSTTVAPVTAAPTTAALGENVTTVEAAQRLLDLFAHLDGEAARLLLQKGAPDAEFDQALQAIYVGDELEFARRRFAGEAGLRFITYVQPPGNSIYRATQVLDARRDDCVVTVGVADMRPRYNEPVQVLSGAFVLVVQSGMTGSGGNPTRWRLRGFVESEQNLDLEAICPEL